MRRLSHKEKVAFKRNRWLLLKNPWNLGDDQKERLSTLVRWNAPIVGAYYLRSPSNVLGLQAAQTRRGAVAGTDALGDALAVGSLQAIRADAARASGWDSGMDRERASNGARLRGCALCGSRPRSGGMNWNRNAAASLQRGNGSGSGAASGGPRPQTASEPGRSEAHTEYHPEGAEAFVAVIRALSKENSRPVTL